MLTGSIALFFVAATTSLGGGATTDAFGVPSGALPPPTSRRDASAAVSRARRCDGVDVNAYSSSSSSLTAEASLRRLLRRRAGRTRRQGSLLPPSSVVLNAVDLGSGGPSGSSLRNDTSEYRPAFDPLFDVDRDDLLSSEAVLDAFVSAEEAAANEDAMASVAAVAAAAAAAASAQLDSLSIVDGREDQVADFFYEVVEDTVASSSGTDSSSDFQEGAGAAIALPDPDLTTTQEDNGIDDSVFFDEIVEEAIVVGPHTGGPAEEDGAGSGTATADGIPPGSTLFDVIEEEEVESSAVAAVDPDDGGVGAAAEAPSVREILRFAVSAIGVWLCGPILSMIDTSAVGLLSGTAQQAALNPAVSVTDYGGLLVAFMYTATTNLVAAARQADRSDPAKPQTTRTVISALRLALLVGMGFGLGLSLCGRVLLRTLIGNDAIDPAVFSAALRYVRIRSLGMPAAVVIGTAQSACLGMRDLKSPLYVLLAAAVINFLGDAVFVRSPSLWVGGAAGAAWATVFSQYAAMIMFVKWFRTKPREKKGGGFWKTRAARAARAPSDDADELLSSSDSTKENEKTPPPPPPMSRGFLSGRFNFLDLFRKPEPDVAREFLPYVGPVTSTNVGRISGYLAMSHVASSALGTVDMAAQQIVLSFFLCLSPVSDSLNLTAQSFIPSIFARPWGKERSDAMRKAVASFLRAGGIIGAALVALVSMIPVLGRLFTADPAVLAQVNTAVPGVALFFALSGFVMSGEGMFLGQRDLKFLGNIYGAFFLAVPAMLLRLKRRALAGVQDVGVGTMWSAFSAYQVVRLFIWAYRIRYLQRQRDAEAEGESSAADANALLRP